MSDDVTGDDDRAGPPRGDVGSGAGMRQAKSPATVDGREGEMAETKERDVQCDFCGEWTTVAAWQRRPYSCGAIQCEREGRAEEQAEREQAHHELDRLNGWDW